MTLGKDRLRSAGIVLLTIGVFLAGLLVVDRLERRAADEAAVEARRGDEIIEEHRPTSDRLGPRTMQTIDEPTEGVGAGVGAGEGDGGDPTAASDDSARLVPLAGPAYGAVERWAAGLDGVSPHFARTAAADHAVSILLLDGETPAELEPIDAVAVDLALGSERGEESGGQPSVIEAVPPFIVDGVIAEVAPHRPASAVYRLLIEGPAGEERVAVREYLVLFAAEASFLLRFYVAEGEIFDMEISPVE